MTFVFPLFLALLLSLAAPSFSYPSQCPSNSLCSSTIPLPSGVNTSIGGVPRQFGEVVRELDSLLSNVTHGIPDNSTSKALLTIYRNASSIHAAWDSLAARALHVIHNSVLNTIDDLNFARVEGVKMLNEYNAASSTAEKAAINASFTATQKKLAGNQAADEVVVGSAAIAVNDFAGVGMLGSLGRSATGYYHYCGNRHTAILKANVTYTNAEIQLDHCPPSNTSCITHWKQIAAVALADIQTNQTALWFCNSQATTFTKFLNLVEEFTTLVFNDVGSRLDVILANEKSTVEQISSCSLSAGAFAKPLLASATQDALYALSISYPTLPTGCELLCGL